MLYILLNHCLIKQFESFTLTERTKVYLSTLPYPYLSFIGYSIYPHFFIYLTLEERLEASHFHAKIAAQTCQKSEQRLKEGEEE